MMKATLKLTEDSGYLDGLAHGALVATAIVVVATLTVAITVRLLRRK